MNVIDEILSILLREPLAESPSERRERRRREWFLDIMESGIERERRRRAADAANAPPTRPS
jgi:hypothetical protein